MKAREKRDLLILNTSSKGYENFSMLNSPNLYNSVECKGYKVL